MNRLLAVGVLFALALVAAMTLTAPSQPGPETLGATTALWIIPAAIVAFARDKVSALRFGVALTIGALWVYFTWYGEHLPSALAAAHR